ncbi:MAG TPA: DUF3127 domain-containing protein [Chitinophagaceae bacterium]|nr:DUF3127 domain-containing protein [Chitinophagaceae bacterium]
MSFEITGKLVAKYDTVQRTETFRTREFVIEKTEDIGGRVITNFVKFQCVQDRTSIIDRFSIGDDLKVLFNIKGTRWEKNGNVNYITNLDAWRVELLNNSQTQPASANEPVYNNSTDKAPDFVDDLPF